MKYTEAELFDFSTDECEDTSHIIAYDIPDELTDFIADFDKSEYDKAIEMYIDGINVDKIYEHFNDQ